MSPVTYTVVISHLCLQHQVSEIKVKAEQNAMLTAWHPHFLIQEGEESKQIILIPLLTNQ